MEDDIFKTLREEMAKTINDYNSMPVEEMDNLSPKDMLHILNFTFGEESPIGFKENISNSILDQIPFLKLFEEYLKMIEESKEVKLTARGYLPRKMCLDLFGKGIIKEFVLSFETVKLNKETDTVQLQNLRLIGLLSGITKKRKNKISLTQKGKKLFKPENKEALFKEIFITHCKEFNLGFYDGYPQVTGLQDKFGFTLYLLLRYGQEKRGISFYVKKNILAFPNDLGYFGCYWSTPEEEFTSCYDLRIFELFLAHYGLIHYYKDRRLKCDKETALQASPIFNAVFELRPDKFKFKKNIHFA